MTTGAIAPLLAEMPAGLPEAPASLRVVSLIPSATEIICALGLESVLVGRSHECDWPASVQGLPACTRPRLNPDDPAGAIHDRVSELLQRGLSVYDIDLAQLAPLHPTHIVTQDQCEVCAASLEDVQAAAQTQLDSPAQIISLQPQVLADIWADIERVALTLDPVQGSLRAKLAIAHLQQRLEACRQFTSQPPQPTVACIEWTDPLMVAGNWIPELVTLAGGHPLFGRVGQRSQRLQWEDLLAADPDVMIVMPCGYDLEATRQATRQLSQDQRWQKLQAVRSYRVYVTDGSQYFNRPGPRLVDSLEILSEILHPELYEAGGRHALQAWKLFSL